MATFTTQLGEKEYRIVCSTGAEGDTVPYGVIAELECLGSTYYSMAVRNADGEIESCFDEWVIEAKPVVGSDTADAVFDFGDGIEGDEEEEEDESAVIDEDGDEDEDEEDEPEDGDEDGDGDEEEEEAS